MKITLNVISWSCGEQNILEMQNKSYLSPKTSLRENDFPIQLHIESRRRTDKVSFPPEKISQKIKCKRDSDQCQSKHLHVVLRRHGNLRQDEMKRSLLENSASPFESARAVRAGLSARVPRERDRFGKLVVHLRICLLSQSIPCHRLESLLHVDGVLGTRLKVGGMVL